MPSVRVACAASSPRRRPGRIPAVAGGDPVPTLVLTGAEDAICPRELQEELVSGIPGAQHAVIEGAGHMAPLEESAAVAAALRTWLEGET